MAFRFALKGTLKQAFPGFAPVVNILELIAVPLAAIGSVAGAAIAVVDTVLAVVGFILKLALALVSGAGDALAGMRTPITALADEIFRLKDMAANGAVSQYKFEGPITRLTAELRHFFQKGIPNSRGTPAQPIRAMMVIATARASFQGLGGLLGSQKAQGKMIIRAPLGMTMVFPKGATFTRGTGGNLRKYRLVNENAAPLKFDPIGKQIRIDADDMLELMDQRAVAAGSVRLTVHQKRDLYFDPAWYLKTDRQVGQARAGARVDFAFEQAPFARPAGEMAHPAFGAFHRIPAETLLDNPEAAGQFYVDLPVRAGRPGAKYNFPIGTGTVLQESKVGTPRLARPSTVKARGKAQIILNRHTDVHLHKWRTLLFSGEQIYRLEAPEYDDGFIAPGSALTEILTASGARYGLEVDIVATQPGASANRAAGAMFSHIDITPVQEARVLAIVASSPIAGGQDVPVPGFEEGNAISWGLLGLAGGMDPEYPEAFIELDIVAFSDNPEIPDTDESFNCPKGAEFRFGSSSELIKMEASTDIGGGRPALANKPSPPVEGTDYGWDPARKPPPSNPSSAAQHAAIGDLLGQLEWTEARLLLPGRTWIYPDQPISGLDRIEADIVLGKLRTYLRKAPRKPSEPDLIPVPRASQPQAFKMDFEGRVAMGVAFSFLNAAVSVLDNLRGFMDEAVTMLAAWVNKMLNFKIQIERVIWGFDQLRAEVLFTVALASWHLEQVNFFLGFSTGLFELGDYWIFKYEGPACDFADDAEFLLGNGLPDDPEGAAQKVFGKIIVAEDKASWAIISALVVGGDA